MKNKNIHLLTFSTSNWVNSKRRLLQQAIFVNQHMQIFNTFACKDETSLPQSWHEKFDAYRNDNGYAMFSWKPCIILQQLNLMNDGDFLLYVDGGSSLPVNNVKNFAFKLRDLCKEVEKSELNLGVGHYYNKGDAENIRIIRKQILEKFELTNDDFFLHSYPHYEAGAMLIMKSEKSMKFISEWYSFMFNNYEGTIRSDFFDKTGQSQQFLHNGSDQAVLQCMLYKNDLKFYSLGTFFYDFNINTRIRG